MLWYQRIPVFLFRGLTSQMHISHSCEVQCESGDRQGQLFSSMTQFHLVMLPSAYLAFIASAGSHTSPFCLLHIGQNQSLDPANWGGWNVAGASRILSKQKCPCHMWEALRHLGWSQGAGLSKMIPKSIWKTWKVKIPTNSNQTAFENQVFVRGKIINHRKFFAYNTKQCFQCSFLSCKTLRVPHLRMPHHSSTWLKYVSMVLF